MYLKPRNHFTKSPYPHIKYPYHKYANLSRFFIKLL
jgi:hypothetical protein